MSREYPCVYYKNGTCTEDSEPGYVSPCVMGPCSKEKPSNADRFWAMSDEELAAEFVFFCPTNSAFRGGLDYEKPHYTGFDGKYYSTSDEVVHANTKWLQQPAEGV